MEGIYTDIRIKFTPFISSLGVCMDIRYMLGDTEFKEFIPLKSISHIFMSCDMPDSTDIYLKRACVTIPIKYDDLIRKIEELDMDDAV